MSDWFHYMRTGDFEAAWRLSDALRATEPPASHRHTPRHLQRIWDGTPLHGRRVLIRCYHGLGDTVQFIRYAPHGQGHRARDDGVGATGAATSTA